MKQYFKGIGLVVGVAALVFLVYKFSLSSRAAGSTASSASETLGGQFVLEPCYGTPAEALYRSSLGTTTPLVTYLSTTDAASTTLTCFIGDADIASLHIRFTASSTASKLMWHNKFSSDEVAATRNFFSEDGSVIDSAVQLTHGAIGLQNVWNTATTSTSTRNVTITPLADKIIQINFGVAGANGALWAAVIKSKPTR